MTNMIQMCCSFHGFRVFILRTRPDEIARDAGAMAPGRGEWGTRWSIYSTNLYQMLFYND
jgi:hypothetical protein